MRACALGIGLGQLAAARFVIIESNDAPPLGVLLILVLIAGVGIVSYLEVLKHTLALQVDVMKREMDHFDWFERWLTRRYADEWLMKRPF